MRHRLLVILFFAGLHSSLTAQISDNFSDGNFDQNPTWEGDLINFTVNTSGELQLNASVAGTSNLAVAGNIPTAVVWDFRVRLGFSPSNQNYLRVYLSAESAALGSGDGYFLEMGETGSNDPIRLYRQDDGVKTLLGTGTAGLAAVNPDLHIVVTRTFSGSWTVEAASGAGSLTAQISATDATYPGSANAYFGWQCVYTVSNIDKYFLDDLAITLGPPDLQAPQLLSAAAVDETHLNVVFDETLDPVSAQHAAFYVVDNGIGAATSATLQPDGKTVSIALNVPLFTGTFALQTDSIKDIAGNISGPQSRSFQYVKIETAEEFDLLITEIMADPAPGQGLPELEWLELYNRSSKTFDLANFRLKDATGPYVALPTFILEPGKYVAITSAVNVSTLQASTTGAVIGIGVSPTILNNDGDEITLADAGGAVIDQVTYDIDWHTVTTKKDGGWSLERINLNLPCLGAANWQSCPILPGGTPGLQNASISTVADVVAPEFVRVDVESVNSILITFSEGMDLLLASDAAAYRIQPSLTIASAVPLSNDRTRIRLTLSDAIQPAVFYALTSTGTLADCSGNLVSNTDTLYFGLAETPARFDVVINEIMNKPAPSVGLPVAEWFELLNRSNKIIDLASLRIQDLSGSPVTLPSRLLAPGQIVVITATPNVSTLSAIQSAADNPISGAGFSVSLMNDDSDVLLLTNTNGAVIDRVAYDANWHTEAGKKDGGWSLERINPDLPCLGSENWQSCPSLPGGTPGGRNASYQQTVDENEPHLLWAYPESSTSVTLTFNEGIDETAASNTDFFLFSPALDVVSSALAANPAQVQITLQSPMQAGIVYQLISAPGLTDCAGNASSGLDTIFVGIPLKPAANDLVINEVMYNPATGRPRYIEFYNPSGKVFDWSEFFIADFSAGASVRQVEQSRLALPGQFHVFTTDAPNVREQYANIIQRNVMGNELPTLDGKAGNVTLYWAVNGDTVVVDALDYSDDWHNGLLSVGDRDGVALERIRIESQTNNAANWTSAAPTVTGWPGTPTLPNSQRLGNAPVSDGFIKLDPARLSPDDDGREDFLDIRYTLPEGGFAATVTVYDSDGIPMKKLARQELIGTEGSLRWDGDFDNGEKARPGIYILFVELFSPDGTVHKVKKICTVVN